MAVCALVPIFLSQRTYLALWYPLVRWSFSSLFLLKCSVILQKICYLFPTYKVNFLSCSFWGDISSLQSLLINHQDFYSVYATVMDLCGFCGVQHLGYNREDMIAPASVFKAFLLYNLWWKSYKISLWMKSVHSQDLLYCIVGEVCSLHTTHPCCQLLQDLVSAAPLETGQGVTFREWSPQNPSAACVRNELWGSLKQMNELPLAGHAVNAFSEIQVVWERRQVTERWHNLDNGDVAFRLVHF